MLTRGEFLRLSAAAVAAASVPGGAAAQSVAEFYRGRTITLVIPTAPGGINSLAGRLVARHLGRFVPGARTIVAENREQGGGLALVNAFANGAPKDGTVIANVQRAVPQLAIQGERSARFDPMALT